MDSSLIESLLSSTFLRKEPISGLRNIRDSRRDPEGIRDMSTAGGSPSSTLSMEESNGLMTETLESFTIPKSSKKCKKSIDSTLMSQQIASPQEGVKQIVTFSSILVDPIQEDKLSSIPSAPQPSWQIEDLQKVAGGHQVHDDSLQLSNHFQGTNKVDSINLLPSNEQSDALKTVICSLLTGHKVNTKDLSLWLQQKLLNQSTDFEGDGEGDGEDYGEAEGDGEGDGEDNLYDRENEQETKNEAEHCTLIVRNRSNEYHICHRCASYKTHFRNDMVKHFERSNTCQSNLYYTKEKAINYSISKKYLFTFPIEKLTLNDYIFIIQNYSESYNVINEDYRNESVVNSAATIQSLVVSNKNYKKGIKKAPRTKRDDEYNQKYYDEKSGKYVCDLCNTSYAKKQNLEQHQRSQTKCIMLQRQQMILEANKQVALKIKSKREADAIVMNTYITNNTLNNNNSITNNQNNTQNLKVEVRDFIQDRYDVSHIKPAYCEENKDFFIYDKFLDMVMMNDQNHNIFFTDDRKHAVVYTGKEFVLMKSDKAGYFMLGNLKKCIGEVVCVQKEEIKTQQPQIERYYNLVERQYQQDTTLRRYNVDTHEFYSDSMCINFRNRDDKLRKIINNVSKHSSSIRDTLDADTIDVANMLVYDPPIPDYQSARNRNRDLKDKD